MTLPPVSSSPVVPAPDVSLTLCCGWEMKVSLSECGRCMVWRCTYKPHHTRPLEPHDIHNILEVLDGEIPGVLAYAEEDR